MSNRIKSSLDLVGTLVDVVYSMFIRTIPIDKKIIGNTGSDFNVRPISSPSYTYWITPAKLQNNGVVILMIVFNLPWSNTLLLFALHHRPPHHTESSHNIHNITHRNSMNLSLYLLFPTVLYTCFLKSLNQKDKSVLVLTNWEARACNFCNPV